MGGRFAGKTVLVTGAAAGLGRAHALAFAREGATILISDVNEAGMAETRALVEAEGAGARTHRVDMGDETQIADYGREILAAHDRLDVLINNAGLHMGEIARGFLGLGMAKWQYFYAVNVLGPLLLAEAVRPALAAAKGLIINKSSMASYRPATAYGITKASLNLFTHAMAQQFGPDQIRCVGIAPGLMITEATRASLGEDKWAELMSQQLVKRAGTAEDIANLAVFLASDEGSFINDLVILCDGGNAMRSFRF
jgi:3-oxoacyl-[acyl-carrier protein] reductase